MVTMRVANGQIVSVDPGDQALIQQTQSDLNRENSISTSFTVSSDYKAKTLTFSGQLPVYSDIEAEFAQNGVGAGDSYDITSVVSDATAKDLRTAGTNYPVEITNRYLQLPAVTDRVHDLAEQLAAGKNNPYDIASTIETYLRTNLKYNENVGTPPKGEDAVDWFLFESKQGYCTFYASAMIEMLRVLNIPSRLDVGFYPAPFDSASNGFLYRDLNAHAWVEVYFPQYGWVPFEPTAARAEINRQTPAAAATTGTNPANSGAGPTAAQLREQDFLDENSPVGGGPVGPISTNHSIGIFGWAVRAMIVVLLGLLGFMTYLWLRGLRGLSPTSQLFTKAQRGASWGGVAVRSSMTPYERAAVIADQVPGSRLHVRYLADLYVRERYGGTEPDPQELSRARHAWLRLRSMMLKYLLVGRWRASARRAVEPIEDE
jgi:transglutaminase-like putative cysteine protease